MGVWQCRAPWRSCGSRPARISSETAPGDRPVFAAQDAMHIGGGATKEVYLLNSVGEQTAVSGKGRHRIHRRNVVSGRRRYDRRTMCRHEHVRHDDKATSLLPPKGDDGSFDFCIAMNGRNDWRDLE